ncbi:MAG: septal ring lytic transglycosylase RlpA family protein [Alphaproteobacteria bacterium]|nr:septal ring lytic transglycosylase RlpA family protein [Alphaproteobacteria bacterium]MDB5722646.1 septal ring lytic transglycosylase RlpA family protein [Alphaproteobacteria bacterium]
MIEQARKNALRCVVALGLGFSGAAPAQPVSSHIVSLAEDVNALPDDSIQPTLDQSDSIAGQTYEAVGQGQASYYGAELAGHRTASGERFDPGALTAAHRTLPLGSRIRVTNISNGMSVIVRVNDRGPGARSRILDISLAAARQISMIRSGKAQVRLELVRYG